MTPSSSRYRRLFSAYMLPHWRWGIVLLFLMAVTVGLQLANPQVLRLFIDRARGGASPSSLLGIGVLFLAVALLTQVTSVVETYVAENLGWLATNRLRADLALHCLKLDPPFHAAHTPGELIERIDGDVLALSNFFSRFVIYVLGNALLFVFVLVLFWSVDPRVGAAMTLLAVVTALLIYLLRGIATPRWNAARQANAELMGFIEERISGTEDIRANGGTAYVMRRLYELGRLLLHRQRGAQVLGMAVGWVVNISFYSAMAIALGLGGYLFQHGTISIGTVYLLFAYAQMLERPIEMIARQMQDLQQAGASIRRVENLLALRPVITDGPGTPIPAGALSLDLCDVSFAYGGDEPVLQSVTIHIRPGRVLGVLGRTGSGKTTLTRLIFRLYDPEHGSVRLGGVDVRGARLDDLRSRVGMVTQDIQLFHASVRDNLTLFDPEIPDERIEVVLDDLGLGPWWRSLPRKLDTRLVAGASGLSAGEAQLLAFARVFLRDPGLVILDEASSRLDPATERLLERAVDRLLLGRTGIIIAHRLGTIRRADDIVILEDGRVVEHGSRGELEADERSRLAALLRAGAEEALV